MALPVAAIQKRQTPWGSIIALVLALLYGASPIDLIPDVIPLIGWADDVVVMGMLILLALVMWRNKKRRMT